MDVCAICSCTCTTDDDTQANLVLKGGWKCKDTGGPAPARSSAWQAISCQSARDNSRKHFGCIVHLDFQWIQRQDHSPGSPKAKNKPALLITNRSNDGFVAPPKQKSGRNAIHFSNMLVKQSAQPLDGIATSNYFLALQTMETKFELRDLTTDKQFGVRHQILHVDVKRPDVMKTSTESSFFVEKHHTKIKRVGKASSVLEVAESMLNDENTALLNILPDCLATADTQVDGVHHLLEHAINPGHITKSATASPLAFNSALSLKMVGNGTEIAEVAQLYVINRVLCATWPNYDATFSTKWKKQMKTPVPSKRGDIFKTCATWWTSSGEITELSRASKALSLFELMLMSIAPTIVSNDHWIQYITGQPVEWIPAHHTRLLHPNTLLRLLRSELGAHCMQQWREVQWRGLLLYDLEKIRELDGFYPADSSVLQLQAVEGGVVMVAGVWPLVAKMSSPSTSWSNISVLSVNTNGIKKNGHLFIESMLSKYSMSCVQETKFGNSTSLSTFKFHLASCFEHKVFVDDPNSQLHRSTRGRSNGVLTVLRFDFPGFDSAVTVPSLSVSGRYLVVKVMVEGTPIYVHNVYVPVDRQEKQQLFSSLVTEEFDDHATHFVLGDLNTPLDPRLDSSSPDLRYDPGRSSCVEWLARLGVVDAWRTHFGVYWSSSPEEPTGLHHAVRVFLRSLLQRLQALRAAACWRPPCSQCDLSVRHPAAWSWILEVSALHAGVSGGSVSHSKRSRSGPHCVQPRQGLRDVESEHQVPASGRAEEAPAERHSSYRRGSDPT